MALPSNQHPSSDTASRPNGERSLTGRIAHRASANIKELLTGGPSGSLRLASLARPSARVGRRGRVVSVVPAFPLFSETFIVDKALRLLDQGWDVQVVARRERATQWQYFPELRARADFRARIHVAPNVETTIASLKPDVVHFEFGMMAVGQMGGATRRPWKTVVSFRGIDASAHGLDDPTRYQDVWDHADLIHVESRDMWERVRQRGCPAYKPHVLIPAAADVDTFADVTRIYTGPIGSPYRPLRILSVGRLVWKKGHPDGVAAVAELVAQGIHCEYRIAGDSRDRGAVLFAIRDHGLEDQVTLLGALPRAAIKTQMLWADVLLHPSVSEGFGIAVIEAQAAGLPVVCTDAEGLPENVVDGTTGFVVPRRNPAAMAEKLATLARDSALRQRLGTAGRTRAQTHFRLEDQARQFDEVYRRLVDIRYRAQVLSDELMAEPSPQYAPDLERLFQLEQAYSDGHRHA
ncbi:MAG: glycosyltransferase family 4 protein [Chloroflexota bacterium]|nr:glycosyltransferase family 4 protein [Chloroflexota bacterium]